MWYAFRWNAFNLAKIDKHGLSIDEVEYVVNNARRPYPIRSGSAKWFVAGTTAAGLWIEVVYLIDDDDDTLFVIHARPLTASERDRAQRNIRQRKHR